MQKKLLAALLMLLAVCCGICIVRSKEDIPQELLDFAERYPEAAGYVRAYPWEHDKPHDIDLSGETEGIPLLLQWDKRWGYAPYGDGWIGNAGCGPTSLSMVLIGLTGDVSLHPQAVAAFSEEHGWYEAGVGTAWELFTEGAPLLGLHVEEGTISGDYIREHLTPETPMIASMRPGDFTKGGHLLVLRGLDADGKVLVNDPNSPKRSRKAWDMEVIVPQIKGIWRFSI